MSPPALPILAQPFGVDELVRDAAAHNRSAIPGQPNRAGTDRAIDGSVSYPKFERFRQTRPAEIATVLVRGLRRYAAGWNGFGAEAPREASIRDSLDFLSRTSSNVPFQVDLDEDGAVNLAVDFASVRVLLTFEGDGRIAISQRADSVWLDVGTIPIRGDVGRASPDVERLLTRD